MVNHVVNIGRARIYWSYEWIYALNVREFMEFLENKKECVDRCLEHIKVISELGFHSIKCLTSVKSHAV